MPPAPCFFFSLEEIVKFISVCVELGDMCWWLAKAHPVLSGMGVFPGTFPLAGATGGTGWGAEDEEVQSLLGPHPYYCSWVSVLYSLAILLHGSEAEKDLGLWVWFMPDICKTIAFSPVLANIRANFCQQVKYLEIRRLILLLHKSSFNESPIQGLMCRTEPRVRSMHKCQSAETPGRRAGCSPRGEWQDLCWTPASSRAQATTFSLRMPRLFQYLFPTTVNCPLAPSCF